MAIERERGISVSSAVMSFEHQGLAFNLLDTPGHQDFSPVGFQRGTYRTLTAQRGDRARRRPKGAKGGIDGQWCNLFEDLPVRNEQEARFERP